MIKIGKLIEDAGILQRDLSALDILVSGKRDSPENKLAVKTFLEMLKAQCNSITKELERQANSL